MAAESVRDGSPGIGRRADIPVRLGDGPVLICGRAEVSHPSFLLRATSGVPDTHPQFRGRGLSSGALLLARPPKANSYQPISFQLQLSISLRVRSPGPPAERHAPSEILESFRSLVRFPPGHPWRVRHRIPSNQAFSQGGDRGETREA